MYSAVMIVKGERLGLLIVTSSSKPAYSFTFLAAMEALPRDQKQGFAFSDLKEAQQ
jgi:hypothetical protein